MSKLTTVARRAMVEHGLSPDFSADVLRQARSLSAIAAEKTAQARDLRQLLWSSIDNDDSRDLDQLTVAQGAAGGRAKILIAIAHVSAWVEKHSPIDDHARHNTTSVYTAARVFPMLPERLSNDLTSLVQGQERLAIVVEMMVDSQGAIERSDLYHARVFNHAKLAYDSVAAWLDGGGPAPERLSAVPGLDQQLRLQDRVAQALKSAREVGGALSFETARARPVFKDGALTDLRSDEPNRAKELIEEFMIAANGVVARYLRSKGRASLRRVLRAPERWARIVALASRLGSSLPVEPDAAALSTFLASRREEDPEGYADFSLCVIKLLGSSEYAVEAPEQQSQGHFGLAVREYTHSTAPNRRFPDLVAQRLLEAALTNAPAPYSTDELQIIAAHCTEQERNAAKVERQVRKAAGAVLLSDRIGDRFDAIVTGASTKGTWVRVAEPAAEGKVVRNAAGLDVGDRTQVELVSVDVDRGFIDFARVT